MNLGAAVPVADEAPAPQAFWFGPRDRPLFGWYHPGCGAALRDTGVVLCNPFGYEAMAVHRAYRRLATRLASTGHPVLRFDYDGTGDSGGELSDPDRVPAWLASIEVATLEIARSSGVSRTVLFGARFGALLALAYAARRPVDGLVLLAPPESAKALMREMAAIHGLKHLPPRPAGMPQEPEEAVVGFPLDAATREALLGLELFAARPARRVLVIARDDVPAGEENLAKKLREIGAKVSVCTEPGYAGMVARNPVRATFPDNLFDAIQSWLATAEQERARPFAPPQLPSAMSTATPAPSVREEAVVVDGDLFGVWTEPAKPKRRPTAILLLNVGADHHVGSNRLYVKMARAWAQLGYRVLRLDFAGVGDSPARNGSPENDIYSPASFPATRAAIDFAAGRGASRFVLMGLCSGAYVSYHTALSDPRVSGIVMINVATFHWTEGDFMVNVQAARSAAGARTRIYLRKVLWPKTWRQLLRGKVHVSAIALDMARRARAQGGRKLRALFTRLRTGEVEVSDIRRGFERLCGRGTKCMLVFGSFEMGVDILEQHLGPNARAMRDAPGFRLELVDGVDHTFTPLWGQKKLIGMLTDYLLAEHGEAA